MDENTHTHTGELGKTAGGVREASRKEVDNVYEGEGMCQVGPAWFSLLQLDCLTPVKPGLFHWRSLALFLDRRSGILAHLACRAQQWFCLRSLSPPVRGARGACSLCPCLSDPTLCLESVFARPLAARKLQRQCVQKVEWIRGSDLGLSRIVNAFASLASSCHVPLFTTRLSGWTSKTRPVCTAECHACPYHKTSDCMCLPASYF